MNNVQINKLNVTEASIKEIASLMADVINERKSVNRRLEILKRELNPLKTERSFLKREGRISNLLISIKDLPAPCGMKLNSELRVKAVFQGPICNGETCPLYDCCQEIVSISSLETSPKLLKGKGKKTVIKRSATSSSVIHKTKKSYDKDTETVIITIANEEFRFDVSKGIETYKKELKSTFTDEVCSRLGINKLTSVAGFKHRSFTDKFQTQ